MGAAGSDISTLVFSIHSMGKPLWTGLSLMKCKISKHYSLNNILIYILKCFYYHCMFDWKNNWDLAEHLIIMEMEKGEDATSYVNVYIEPSGSLSALLAF